ncbi:TPA: helix-turn-helix transcriptional regulator [Streptococcus suis]|nr:helix-turn-helix transcriptional regulator [Streptococcus suis]
MERRKELIAIISFRPLWKTTEAKNVSQYRLLKSGIDNKTLDSLKKNKNITLLTLEKLCVILSCTPNDIIEFTNDST